MIRALAVLALLTAPALAQQNIMPIPAPCGPRGEVEGILAGKYGENPVVAGHNPAGWPLVVTANPATGTYTVLLRRPDGMTCLIAGGKGFTLIEASPVAKGTDL